MDGPTEKTPKACWYPFKKAYERRRIQPNEDEHEHEHNPNVLYLNTRNGRSRRKQQVEVSVYEYEGRGTQQQGETELVLEGHPSPLEMLELPPALLEEVENNSLVSEEEWLRHKQGLLETSHDGLASINANCMSKEFWVDEMVEGGSLACVEEFLPQRHQPNAGSAPSTMGRSSNDSLGGSSNWSMDSKNVRFVAAHHSDNGSLPGDGNASISEQSARIQIDCDLVEHDQKPRGGQLPPSEVIEISGGSSTGKPRKVRIEPTGKRSEPSIVSSQKSGSAAFPGEADDGVETLNTTATSQDASLGTEPVSPKPRSMAKRVLCVARPFRRRKKELERAMREQEIRDAKARAAALQAQKDQAERFVASTAAETEEENPANVSGDSSSWLSSANLGQSAMMLGTALLGSKDCAMPGTFQQDLPLEPDHPEFFIEAEATSEQLDAVRDLEDIKAEEPILLAKEMALARSSSLVDEDSAFMEPVCMPDVMKPFTPSRAKKTDPFVKYRKRWPDEPLAALPTTDAKKMPPNEPKLQRSSSRPRNARIRIEEGPQKTETSRPPQASKSLEPQVVPYTPEEMDELARVSTPQHLEGREAQTSAVDEQDVVYSNEFIRRSSPPKEKVTSYPEHTESSLRKTRSRSRDDRRGRDRASSSRKPVSDEEMMEKSEFGDVSYDTSNSPWRNKVAEKRRERARSLGRVTMKQLTGHDDSIDDVDDMTTEIGEGYGPEDIPNQSGDYQLARFPSFTTEDWNQAGISTDTKANKPTNGNKSEEFDAAWLDSKETERYTGRRQLRGEESWDQIHGIQRAPSLDDSFDKALPYIDEQERGDQNLNFVGTEFQMDRPRSKKKVIRSPRRMQNPPFKSWVDGDDDSELNTEAFRQLSAENDEDSIFNGLVSPSYPSGAHRGHSFRRSPQRQKIQKHTPIEESSRGSISTDSDQSPDRSRYRTRAAGDASRVSRGDFSRVSKDSKYSRFSRGDITAYTDAYEEEFNCMDNWIGY